MALTLVNQSQFDAMFIDLTEIANRTGYSRAGIIKRIEADKFPQPDAMVGRSHLWLRTRAEPAMAQCKVHNSGMSAEEMRNSPIALAHAMRYKNSPYRPGELAPGSWSPQAVGAAAVSDQDD